MNSRCRLSRHSNDFSASVVTEYFSSLFGEAEDDVVVVEEDRDERVFMASFVISFAFVVVVVGVVVVVVSTFWFKSFCF